MDYYPLLEEILKKNDLIEAVLSAPNRRKIKPIAIKNQFLYQIEEHKGTKAFHRNVTGQELLQLLVEDFLPASKEAIFYSRDFDLHLVHGKVHKKKPTKTVEAPVPHNREKRIPLSLAPLPFLVELGVVKPSGHLVPAKADKFKQINRFLELVGDVLPKDSGKTLHIVDFGCGKGYLTFALYHWLVEVLQRDVEIYGLDLKKEVIENLQALATQLDFKKLHFQADDIRDFKPKQPIDMVIALHACNTATDFALEQALIWKASIILAAPCCHQELYSQIESSPLESLLRHGIIKEKLAALATDALRADFLEMQGYKTQIIEFVDPEHTPKNLMIRAVKGSTPSRIQKAHERFTACKAALHVQPRLIHFG